MATGGYNFGAIGGTTTAGTGFSFGAQKTTAAGLTIPSLTPATTSSSGLGFSLTSKTTAPSGLAGFSLSTPATKPAATAGFNFGLGAATTTTTASGGFPLGGAVAPTAATTAPSAGFNFGLTPGSTAAAVTTTSAPAAGLTFGTTTSAPGGGLAGFNFGGTSSGPTLGLGGLGATTTGATAASIFSKTSTAPTFTGLGGVDPKTSSAGTAGGSGTGAEGKAVKEAFIPDLLVTTVDDLQKYVKGEKSVREDIVRMSSKPLMRVQEDTAALKQLLSVVSNGLQRNACTLDKLKVEMTQELKNAEMAQRTKDIPPGLQYENTAPLGYFSQMVEQFEGQMLSYRQQIEMLENHLLALQQPVRHSPEEIFTLIKKQHQSFIALAAHLQEVHESIKVQKEQFLTYRRIFHGETKNIFQQAAAPAAPRPVQRRPADIAGPTPFPGVTNAAAAAMASVMNRPQQPHGGLLGQPGMGMGGAAVGGGFPTSFSLGAGSASASSSALASTLGSLNNTANASLNVSAATKQPFTLQKPPLGAKRGKR